MGSELKERVLRELSSREVLHIREIVNRINTPISVLRQILNEMIEEGLLERFSHGGYTFYRITEEGRGYLVKRESESPEGSSDKGEDKESSDD